MRVSPGLKPDQFEKIKLLSVTYSNRLLSVNTEISFCKWEEKMQGDIISGLIISYVKQIKDLKRCCKIITAESDS